MTNLEKMQALDKDILMNFLKTRKDESIAPKLQDYILKMDATSSIIHYQGASLKRVTQALMLRYPEMTYSQAREMFYDAMEFFYIDDNISAASWDNYYADRMEDIFRLAVKMNRLDIAFKASVKAHEYRTQNRNLFDPEEWKPPVFVITNELTPEDLGYTKRSVYEIARKKEQMQYRDMIAKLPASEAEKARLMKEAGVQDTTFEEVGDED